MKLRPPTLLLAFLATGFFANAQNRFMPSPAGFGTVIPMIASQGNVFCMARENADPRNYTIFRLSVANNSLVQLASDTALGGVDLKNFFEANGSIYFTGRFGLHRIDNGSGTVNRVAKFSGALFTCTYNFNGKVFFTCSDSRAYVYNPQSEAVDTLKYNNEYVNPGNFPQAIVYDNKLFFLGQGTGAQASGSYFYQYGGTGNSVVRGNSSIGISNLSITTSVYQSRNFNPVAINGSLLFYLVSPALSRFLVSVNLTNINNISYTILQAVDISFGCVTPMDGFVYFKQNEKLWKTDGLSTPEIVSDIELSGFDNLQNNAFAVLNGKLVGTRTEALTGTELWTSDGTTAGTTLLYDLFNGLHANSNNDPVPNSGNPVYPVLSGNNIYFLAAGPGTIYDNFGEFNSSYYVWKTDGTPEGTEKYSSIECESYLLTKVDLSETNGNVFVLGRCGINQGLFMLKPLEYLGSNNTWENPLSWSGNTVPGMDDDVIVKSGSLSVQSNATARSLKLSDAATLSVQPGYSLTVTY